MSDPRECGWMGCDHPRCADRCAPVPLDEWRRRDDARARDAAAVLTADDIAALSAIEPFWAACGRGPCSARDGHEGPCEQ